MGEKLTPRSLSADNDYSNQDDDIRGIWTSNALQSRNYYSKGTYEIKCPGGGLLLARQKGPIGEWRKLNSGNWIKIIEFGGAKKGIIALG